jgi:UDP-3-O-[3-hydroxymyristoyl] glucosamine N-acyltransferase
MVDERFYSKKPYLTIGSICGYLNIDIPTNCFPMKRIENVAPLDKATSTDITFFHNIKYADMLAKTRAFACIVSQTDVHLVPQSTVSLIVDEPYLAYATVLGQFYSANGLPEKGFISRQSSIAKSAIVENGCYISDFVVIADNVVVRAGTFVGENTVIQHGVEIGERSHIESNVTIGFAVIGRNVHIKTGARIGQQGFGFHVGRSGPADIPHVGTVIIGDNTLIGANSTIDRGSISNTVVGDNTRIDNMVHIAHNVTVGNCCIIAAQTGIAGSTTIGNSCIIGGQVGIAGHLTIGDNVTIAAQSGVMRNVPSGSKIAGSPSVDVMSWHRQTITLRDLAKNTRAGCSNPWICSLMKRIFRQLFKP